MCGGKNNGMPLQSEWQAFTHLETCKKKKSINEKNNLKSELTRTIEIEAA